jgi:hypothetical protein
MPFALDIYNGVPVTSGAFPAQPTHISSLVLFHDHPLEASSPVMRPAASFSAWLAPRLQSLVVTEQAWSEMRLLGYFYILYLYFLLAHSLLFGVPRFLTIT